MLGYNRVRNNLDIQVAEQRWVSPHSSCPSCDVTSWRVCSSAVNILIPGSRLRKNPLSGSSPTKAEGNVGKCTPLPKSLPRNDMDLSINMLYKSKAVGGNRRCHPPWGWEAVRPHGHSAFLHWATINWSPSEITKEERQWALAKWS